MPDLRERLTRLSERAEVSPDAWNRFVAVRRRHERRRRVAAVVVSLVVASAGFVGVLSAFRPGASTHRPNGNAPVAGAPFLSLWPQRSIDLGPALMPDVGLVQRRADSGNPDATWQLSPTEVATRFATKIMGWPKVVVGSTTTHPDGSVVVTVGLAVVCTTVNADGETSSPAPCGKDVPLAEGHEITLAQPGRTGPSGVWEVVEVHPVTSSEFDLGVRRGQTLTAGQTLRFSFGDVPPGTLGLTAFYDCGSPLLQVSGTVHVDPNYSTGTLHIPENLPLVGEGCISGTPNGYLYAYSVTAGTGIGDPFKASSEIGEIAIVPVVLSTTHAEARGPTCTSSQLSLGLGRQPAEATQQSSRLFTLTNASTSPCHLDGYPRIDLLDASGKPIPFRYRDGGDQTVTSRSPTPVTLAPGQSAYLMINTTGCVTRDGSLAKSVQVTPPGGTKALSLSLNKYPIIAYCGPGTGSVVDVSPIEPTARDVLRS